MERIAREGLAEPRERGSAQPVEALPANAFAAEHLPGARSAGRPV